MINAFNGAGDTWTPTWINVAGFWCFQVPLAYLLAKYIGMGPKGVFFAVPAAEIGMTIAAVLLFRTGRWKKINV
ncbi:hypothetical protein [Hufsiella ginkgonis]|uniref:hypothetical protein n=1 Tax=Hufsiella ginkgonis TaxID=2695274 RepID=UPI001F31FD57|nr:hypothetical protein [Hufsiella ginkgonis]